MVVLRYDYDVIYVGGFYQDLEFGMYSFGNYYRFGIKVLVVMFVSYNVGSFGVLMFFFSGGYYGGSIDYFVLFGGGNYVVWIDQFLVQELY